MISQPCLRWTRPKVTDGQNVMVTDGFPGVYTMLDRGLVMSDDSASIRRQLKCPLETNFIYTIDLRD